MTYLDRIMAAHRAVASADDRPLTELVRRAEAMPAARGFRSVLDGKVGLQVIAEVKRRSPSKGDLAPELDPAALARRYALGGAACLSVLTDVDFFGGSPDDLREARQACGLPVLRKDFTVSERDVLDARVMGADCVLLIAAALHPAELIGFHRLAVAIGLDVLVEIHDETELAVALDAGASMIGVNQRDLVTFEVDSQRAVRMAELIPDGVVAVAESGVRNGVDAGELHAAGYAAVLVGESLVTAADPSAVIAEMRGN